jgi:hypothetical protein
MRKVRPRLCMSHNPLRRSTRKYHKAIGTTNFFPQPKWKFKKIFQNLPSSGYSPT